MRRILNGTITLILASVLIIALGTGVLAKMMDMTESKTQVTEIVEKQSENGLENENGEYTDEGIGEDIVEKEMEWNGYRVKIYEFDTKFEEGFIAYEEVVNRAVSHLKAVHVNAIIEDENVVPYIEVMLMNRDLGQFLTREVYHVSFYYANNEEELETELKIETAYVVIDAITAETYELYSYKQGRTDEECIENDVIIDGFTEQELGYGGYEGLDYYDVLEHYHEKIESVKEQYEEIAGKFIKENLDVGELTDIYVYGPQSNRLEGEYYMTFCCDVSNGEMILMKIDQIDKTIVYYQKNPSDVELEALLY